jgi:RNA polymerase sigma-70 factor (ECF subfamily)
MMDTERNEYNLAQLARNGDLEALAELVELMRPRLFTLAYAELRHYQDAQDAVASALLQVCLHVGALREPRHVGAWIRRIVRNEALKILERRQAATPLPENDPPAAQAVEFQALYLDIRRALGRIPRDHARAIALFYLAGAPINEIARRTGRPIGTVKRWLHIGRRHLAEELEVYAPMTRTMAATIISTDLDEDTIAQWSEILRDAGFSKVILLNALPPLVQNGSSDSMEFHLPEQMADTRFVILDEQVGGRSAFELYTILKAAVESRDVACCIMLSSPPSESTVFAAWAAGFDLCLVKEKLSADEFRHFCGEIMSRLKNDHSGA